LSDVRPIDIAAALLVTALEVAIFILGMRHATQPPALSPIVVRLVTLPAPSAPTPALASPPLAPEPPVPEAPQPVPVEPTAPPPVLERQASKPLPMIPSVKPRPPPRNAAQAKPRAAPPRAVTLGSPAPAGEAASAGVKPVPAAHPLPPGGGTMGARAIYRPMPAIPEELRRHPMAVTAVARFRVAPDGTATVALIRPTPIPLLNVALLAALQRWRFFPAMANGQPVTSTIDIRIPLAVR
jgi:periplasmic protein TonB